MDLSLELMELGSYQAAMSDEGLMTDDIEDCLRVVINALLHSTLPAKEVLAWRQAMSKKDHGGFICDDELQALEKRFQVSR